MNKTRDRTGHLGSSERDAIRIRRAILQFVTGHPYCELPASLALPEPMQARHETRAERVRSVLR